LIDVTILIFLYPIYK